ncbi:MAG: site-specific integrase [Chloroflexota bacterium]
MVVIDQDDTDAAVISLHETSDEMSALAGSLYRESRERARDYADNATALNTRRAYRADWRHFSAWCAIRHLAPLPATPETVAVYLADLAPLYKTATITRRMSAIAQAHKTAGFPSPTTDAAVRQVAAGIRRRHGTQQQGKEAALTADLRAMVETLDGLPRGRRDRALLLLGFAGAFRRSELVALDLADVARTRDGLVVTVRRGKTDQEGLGRRVGIPYGSTPTTCPVRALEDWLEAARITAGPLFHPIDRHGNLRPHRLTDQSVALVVKRAAQAAGLDPALYAGHSLRSGLATAAAQAGVSERTIMEQTGHKSLPIVRRYIRRGSLFTENAAAKVGL